MRSRDFYFFPYDLIPPKSKVIIYAMGNVGKCFWEQIRKNKYCEIVACADQNADNTVKYDLIFPSQIEDYKYDYIVIAVESDALATNIIHNLTSEHGISKEKCIFKSNSKTNFQVVAYSWNDVFKNKDLMRKAISNFWTSESKIEEFFCEWIYEVNGYDRNEVKKYIMSFLSESYRNNILIYRLMYACNLLDSDLYEMYLASVKKIQNVDDRIWSLYDISVIERDNQEIRYPKFYADKREIIESLFSDIVVEDTRYNVNEKGNRANEVNDRIAIITFGLNGERASHNALIVPYANEMQKQGKKVGIFPVDLLRYRYGEAFIRPLEPIEIDSISNVEYHKRAFDKNIEIFYSDGETVTERAEKLLKDIIGFAPRVVIDFCGEYSYMSAKLHNYFKILAIPMRGYCSSGTFDMYFSRNLTLCKKENNIYHSMDESQMVEALVCSTPVKQIKEFHREEYGLSKDSFVITTVGSRLHSELTDEFRYEVSCFLENNLDSYWILVGERYPQIEDTQFEKLVLEGRIIKWGYENDLIGFYNGICDVYWNPNRMGAGGSIGSAMRCGLPIVTTNFPSDVLPRLGLENVVDGDYKECRKMVQRLHDDKEYYDEKSVLMKARMQISSVSDYVHLLLEKAMEMTE